MNDVVDWLIPDIPKDISLQIHKEKILLVDLFMKEEQGKIRFLERRVSAGAKENCSRSNNNNCTKAHPRSGHTNSTKSVWCSSRPSSSVWVCRFKTCSGLALSGQSELCDLVLVLNIPAPLEDGGSTACKGSKRWAKCGAAWVDSCQMYMCLIWSKMTAVSPGVVRFVKA